ncbi:MAG TPA: BrnA antitoxin family protein [Steroidobacteraceae bacterium]|nr:BrnA antitoxin family protein [Steroidobacteraceae bacterium]
MAKGFFSRFTRTGSDEPPERPGEALPPPLASQAPAPAGPPLPLVEIAREIARQGLPAVPRKAAISLRLDEDVLGWFKAQGPGYQTRINAVLRAYKEAAGQG